MKPIVISLVLTSSAAAQCCLGAQNATVDSVGGRYRVVATSQNGTGHAAHGPYHFVFRTLRVAADGTTTRLGEFERRWDTKKHFGMTICVSPTGNGFLLGSSLEPDVRFYSPAGRVLRVVECRGPQSAWPNAETLSIRLYSASSDLRARETRLWLPLCHVVGPEVERDVGTRKWLPITGGPRWPQLDDAEAAWLARMVTWSAARGERDRPSAEAALARLADGDQRAADALVELGLSAVPLLRGDAHRELRERIDRRLCGHAEPWQNRELLTALLEHPRKILRDAARKQLATMAGR